MNPAAPPLPTNPKPVPSARPLDEAALLQRLIRGQDVQNEYQRQSRDRLTWIAILIALPYIVSATIFIGWLLICGGIAALAGLASADAAAEVQREARQRAREAASPESDPPRFAPPAVGRDGYADPEFPENAAEILRESGF